MRGVRVLLLVAVGAATLGISGRADAVTHVCDGVPLMSNFTLHADAVCTGQSGIVVGRAGITIDLGGHTLTGDRTAGHDGIDDAGGFDNVTIRNGTLTKFTIGIAARNVAGMRVQSINISGNADTGIASFTGGALLISSSLISGNQSDAAYIEGVGVRVSSSRISGNNDGHGYGMWIVGSQAKVSGSVFSGNGGAGPALFITGDFSRVVSTNFYGNGGDGLFVNGNSAKIGRLRRRPASDRNHADGNGFTAGASDGSGVGIRVTSSTVAPRGRNKASGNDDPAECIPASLC